MTPNHVKQRLRAGRPAFGSLLNFGDPLVAEMMAAVGLDWLLVDTEHGPIDLATLATMFATITRYPCAPFVRVQALTEEHVKRMLDAGAWGVLAPNVRTREEAETPSREPPHREFHEAMVVLLAACKRHGGAASIHCQTTETVNRRIAEGWPGMVNDQRYLVSAAAAARAAVKTHA